MTNNNLHAQQLDIFIQCLYEQRFYDAHEAIEILWYKRRFEHSNEIKLLKGFINASVCFELIKRGRIEQSKNVWKTYLKYRQLLYKIDSPYQNRYYQISRYIEKLKLEL